MQPLAGRTSHPENEVLSLLKITDTITHMSQEGCLQSGQSAPPIDHIAKFRLTRAGNWAMCPRSGLKAAKKKTEQQRQFSRLCISWQLLLGGRLSLIYKMGNPPNYKKRNLAVQIVQMLLGCRKCPKYLGWDQMRVSHYSTTTPHSDQHSNSMDGQMPR